MLTSATSGLRILARRDEPAEADWFNLLEERRSLIKGHLHDMTLRSLGELLFVRDYFGDHSLKRYSEALRLTGDARFNLETRAVFPITRGSNLSTTNEWHRTPESDRRASTGQLPGHSSTERFWGLTRDGIWISIEVFITRRQEPYKRPGRTEEVARAETALIKECTPQELCKLLGLTPGRIWKWLGIAVKDWEEHRRILLADASHLARVVVAEEDLVDIVVGKTRR